MTLLFDIDELVRIGADIMTDFYLESVRDKTLAETINEEWDW